jgi:hypothetical protein
MDPITTALVAALGNLAEPAVKDAYEGLKNLIKKKLGEKHPVVEAVQNLEQKPGSNGRRETLGEEIHASPAARDAEILAAAQTLLGRAQKNAGHVAVNQKVKGDRNIFSGTGDISFGGPPR